MKKKYILSIVALVFALIFTGCENAEYDVKHNSIYIAEAASAAKSATVSLETTGADINIVVRLAKKVEQDVEIAIKLNPSMLEEYNKINSTEYELLPGYELSAGAKVTIPAGTINGSYKIHIDNFDTQGRNYAFPIELGNTLRGDVVKSNTQSKFIYLIAKPLIVSVPVMKGTGGKVVAEPTTNWGIEVDQWSLECWVRMDGYARNNQALFDVGGPGSEIFIRFGDANGPYNYLQAKTLGGQVETNRDFVGGIWYHLAFVYNGTTFAIYRNGEQLVKFDPPAPATPSGKVLINKMHMIARTHFINNCGMSQVRLWKTAISPNQIRNNMYYEVNPTNPNLIAYWPMNEGVGDTFADITGNGHTATAENNVIQSWEHNVRFDQ